MTRITPPDRFSQLVDAASRVFVERGYARTQMADVAAAMGVAKGTLYLYVESKEALFDVACRLADTERPLQQPEHLPVPTPRSKATVAHVASRLEQGLALPVLRAALVRRKRIAPEVELEAIVCELYDTVARNRRGLKLIDRSAVDLPELAALWFEGARGGVVTLLAQYLDARIRAGRLRRVPDTAVTARLILETIVFWTVHRHWDARPQAIDEVVVRDTVVDFIVRACAKG